MPLSLAGAFLEVAHAGIAEPDQFLDVVDAGFDHKFLAARSLFLWLVAFQGVFERLDAISFCHFGYPSMPFR